MAIESTLETFDIASGARRMVFRAPYHFEAPNWSRDGKYFLFNSEGRLYRIGRGGGGEPERIDTWPLYKLNNDHGLSPGGSLIAVSDQSDPDGQSRIHVLHSDGRSARLAIEKAPSYWHSWSPDGLTLAYVAARGGGDLGIYTAPAAGGAERRLTHGPGLDDGPDYSADGQFIYFNSMRSGNMKLWRMRADGSAPEQLTFEDETRDWFPHPSPDGRWIVFVSFGSDVAVADHPPGKNVMLRLMRAAGGAARTIAKLFGGQGTINVPSWSPDGKEFAFVSYRV